MKKNFENKINELEKKLVAAKALDKRNCSSYKSADDVAEQICEVIKEANKAGIYIDSNYKAYDENDFAAIKEIWNIAAAKRQPKCQADVVIIEKETGFSFAFIKSIKFFFEKR